METIKKSCVFCGTPLSEQSKKKKLCVTCKRHRNEKKREDKTTQEEKHKLIVNLSSLSEHCMMEEYSKYYSDFEYVSRFL